MSGKGYVVNVASRKSEGLIRRLYYDIKEETKKEEGYLKRLKRMKRKLFEKPEEDKKDVM